MRGYAAAPTHTGGVALLHVGPRGATRVPLPIPTRHDEDFRDASDEKTVDRLLAEANDDYRAGRPAKSDEDSFR